MPAKNSAKVILDAMLISCMGDSATLSRHIKQVLSNEGLRAALAARGKLRARDFSFERMLTGYEDVYRELVRSTNR